MLCVFQISPSISLIMGRVCVCNIKIHIKCNEKEARGEFHLGQEIDGIFAVLKRRFGKTTVRCYYQARYMCRKILNSLQIWKVEFHLIEQKRAIIQSRSMNYTKYSGNWWYLDRDMEDQFIIGSHCCSSRTAGNSHGKSGKCHLGFGIKNLQILGYKKHGNPCNVR